MWKVICFFVFFFFYQKRIVKIKECQAISFQPLKIFPKRQLKNINRFTAIASAPFDRW